MKGKRKSQWHNSIADEEDELKVINNDILVCGVLIRMASIIDSVILGPWIKFQLSLYRHDIKTSQIHSLNTVTFRKFAVGVRTKSNFWIGDWLSFRAGLPQDLEETVSLS